MNIILAGSNNIHSIPEEEFTKEEQENKDKEEDEGRKSPNNVPQQEVA